jgi:hypothetical protein
MVVVTNIQGGHAQDEFYIVSVMDLETARMPTAQENAYMSAYLLGEEIIPHQAGIYRNIPFVGMNVVGRGEEVSETYNASAICCRKFFYYFCVCTHRGASV